jgi:hypothetical protein
MPGMKTLFLYFALLIESKGWVECKRGPRDKRADGSGHLRKSRKSSPQRLKPSDDQGIFGTAEAVPFVQRRLRFPNPDRLDR